VRQTALAPSLLAHLPVLGIPGWWAANDSPDFYADAEVFRQQRRVASEQIPAREA
jgi:hypothetical protein